MTIEGVSGRTSYIGTSILNLRSQLDTLSQQLASGKKSTSYSGLGIDSSVATGLRSQISMLAGYANTATNLNTRINVVNLSLQGLADAASSTKSAASGSSLVLDNNGQTPGQQIAYANFTQAVSLLNAQSGDRYLFSGRATDTPATASADDILNGTTTLAGLKQVIDERRLADQGTGFMGRLQTAQTGPSVSINEDATESIFGLKLASIATTIAGASVTQPPNPPPVLPAAPSEMSVNLTTNANVGDKVTFTFNLPDGTSEAIQLTATTESPPPDGSFTIGADPDATAAEIKTALDKSIQNLVKGPLVAASAMAASDNFFDDPPQRVYTGAPATGFADATGLRNGSADTVIWYTGESGSDSARGTAVVGIDQSITVQYGARANENALRNALQVMATYAAVTTVNDSYANSQMTALNQRVGDALAVKPGVQSIQDIQADFAGAQSAVKAATTRQAQTTSMAKTMLDSIEGVSDDEVAAKLLALQTSLQAAYQTTSSLYQLSLVKFLPV
jgi:flagellin-like hook-associated protein FlgL